MKYEVRDLLNWVFRFGFVGLLGLPLLCEAQGNAQLANMNQELLLMRTQLDKLVLRVELLEADQEKLNQQLSAFQTQQSDLVREFNQLAVALPERLIALEKGQPRIKEEVLNSVATRMTELTREMQAALDELAASVEASAVATRPAPTQFSENYPKTGVAYVVKPGDSLSKIANELGSTVAYIQNANKIENPRVDLKAGQTIFVPQEK